MLSTRTFVVVLVAVAELACTAAAQVVLRLSPGSGAATLAGNGVDGSPSVGRGSSSALGWPRGLAFDAAGDLYVADPRNNVVLRVTPDGGLSIVAGTGAQGYAGDGGSATMAELNAPSAVAVGSGGAVYVADSGNNRIRRISSAGVMTTVVGTGVAGDSGDGGLGTAAGIRHPMGLAVDAAGTLYVADTGNHRVRALHTDGTIVAVAGTGMEGDDGDGGPASAATLREPLALALNADGSLLIGDASARRVRTVSASGMISAFGATTRRPEGLAASPDGSVYVADAGNQVATAVTMDGSSTVLGTGEQGVFAAGLPTDTALDSPAGVALDADGNVVVSDRRNHQVQRISLPRLDFGAVAVGSASSAQTVTLSNPGSGSLQVLAVSVPVGFALVPSATTCGQAAFMLGASAQCVLALSFAPTAQGAQSGQARIRVSGAAPQAVLLGGTGTASGVLGATVTTLTSNGSIGYAGAAIGLNVSVVGAGAAGTPGGTVSVYDGAVLLMQATLNAGTAAMTTTVLTVGQHALTARYSGDAQYAASTSGALTETLVPDPDFTLASASASYSGAVGSAVTVGMTMTPFNGTLNRVVTFASSGLPTGATVAFTPATITLGGDPAAVSVRIQLPATLASRRLPLWPVAAGGLMLIAAVRRRKMSALLCLGFAAAFCVGGCGGFRGGPNTTSTGKGPTPFTVVISATTTGVLGDTLVHSAAVGLVVSQ